MAAAAFPAYNLQAKRNKGQSCRPRPNGRPRVHIVDHYLPRSVDKPSTPRKMMNLHSSRRDDRRKTKPSYGPRSERRCRGIVIVVSLLDLGLSTSSAGDQLLWKGDTPTSTNTAPVEYSVLVTNIPPCVNRVSFVYLIA